VAITVPVFLWLTFGLDSKPANNMGNLDAPNIYNSNTYNFSMQYPKEWIVDETVDEISPTSSALVSFSDPDYEAIIGVAKVNDVAYRSYGILTNVEDFAELTKVQLQQTYGRNIVLTDEGRLTINNVDSYFVEYARLDDSTINKMVFLMNGDTVYLIVFGVDTDSYDKHTPHFEESLSTFKFLSRWKNFTN
jgi:hypothetical protein